MRPVTLGLIVTIDEGRFAGRQGTIIDFGGYANEVWVRWQEGAFKTLGIEDVHKLKVVAG
jgi:hypothetical protein